MMTPTTEHTPAFPIRFILEDGEIIEVAHPDDLFDHFDQFDSTDPDQKVWVRDQQDRNVRLRISDSQVLELEVED